MIFLSRNCLINQMFDSHSRHRDTKSKEKISLILMVYVIFIIFIVYIKKKPSDKPFFFFSILTNAFIYEFYGND